MATQEQIASVIALQQDGDTGLAGWENGQYNGEINSPAELYTAKSALEGDFVVNNVTIDTYSGSTAVGETEQSVYTVTYANGAEVTETSIATWASATPATATIDDLGLVTAVAEGTTNITATVDGETSDPVVFTVPAE